MTPTSLVVGTPPNAFIPEAYIPKGAIPEGHIPEGPIPKGAIPEGAIPEGSIAARLLFDGWGMRLTRRPWRVLFLILAIAVAGLLSYEAVSDQITETGVLHEDRVSLASYLDGTAAQPFVYRIVTPFLMNVAQNVLHAPAILRALPGPVAVKLPQWCALATSVPAPTCDNVAAYFAVAGAMCFCFLMLIYAFGLRLFDDNQLISLLAMYFCFVGVNAILLLRLSHIYDFGTLMFATLLLLCLERRWNIAFTLIMPVAFLTKETLILYCSAFFMANLGHIGLVRNVALTLTQIASFVVLYGLVMWHFSGNAGGGHEYYLPDQFRFFMQEITMVQFLPAIVVVVLTFYGFRNKNPTLRRSCVVLLPWFAAAMLGGEKKELRVMFEVVPLILLLSMDSLVQLILGSTGRRERTPPKRPVYRRLSANS
jgi:hypothetical protein